MVCVRCGKAFKFPYLLTRHLQRKTACAPILASDDLPVKVLEDPNIDKKQCPYCKRVFTLYTSMRRHIRLNCKIAPKVNKNRDTGMNILYEYTIRQQTALLKALQAQITGMASCHTVMLGIIRQLVEHKNGGGQHASEVAPPIPDHHNQVAVDNRKTNIFRAKEGLDYVTVTHIKAILDESMRAPALPKAAQAVVLVYSNPEHPTGYLLNVKTNNVLVRVEEG